MSFDLWFWLGTITIGLAIPFWLTRSALKRDDPGDWVQMKRLADKGINLERPREVEFRIFLRTKASAAHVASELANWGFETAHAEGHVEVRRRGTTDVERSEGFLVSAKKVLVLYGDTLRALRRQLATLAEKEGGIYIGWQALDDSPLGSAGGAG
jgi:hypothetical protein